MSRRHPGGRTLPDNPTWIEFPRSDANAAVLPKNTTRIVERDGQVNYMRPVPLDESLAIMWRVAVGSQLAIRLQLPEGPAYVLKSFPEGYQLYDHNKGPASAPRHDPYLCGSVNVNRFRSTNEFIPHALWLMQDVTMSRSNCLCKYCTKQPQRIISDNMGLSQRPTSSVAGTSPRTTRTRKEPRDPPQQQRVPVVKPYAAVRRSLKPPKTLVGPGQYVSPERDLDIRTSLSYGENQRPRWFRKGELVWCKLDPPICGRAPEESITFWPGLVNDVHVKTLSLPREGNVDFTSLYAEAAEDNPALSAPLLAGPAGLSAITAPVETPGLPPWAVSQWYDYKVKLLGTHVSVLVSDEQVLPYLAYAPSDSILHGAEESLNHHFHTFSIEQIDDELEQTIPPFDPMEPEPEGEQYFAKYQRAALAFTLAIQIAAGLVLYWLPTDEWECTFMVPPAEPESASRPQSPSRPRASQSSSQVQTLHSVLQQYKNAMMKHPESASTAGRHSRASPQQSVKQKRFQGLWWGTERIWTDELVRLKIARCQFAPKGTDTIYPPAGPSATTLAELGNSPDPASISQESLGASEKGLFMRLEGLFIVDVPGADGIAVTKECRASGVLYELVEQDWEEVVEANKVHEVAGMGKGKGKAGDFAQTLSPSAPPVSSEPPPLPNSDSTAETPADATDAGQSLSAQQLSHPVLSTPYPLPPPPHGFRFRPILKPGHEVVINLSLISGRYYPGLLYHPQMVETVQKAMENEEEHRRNQHLWAMDGLVPGVRQSMEPRHWKSSRVVMLQEADKLAREKLRERWEETKMARLQPPDTKQDANWKGISVDKDMAMEVDT